MEILTGSLLPSSGMGSLGNGNLDWVLTTQFWNGKWSLVDMDSQEGI